MNSWLLILQDQLKYLDQNKMIKLISYALLVHIVVSCENSESHTNQGDSLISINQDLRKDAENGRSYEGQFFQIITDSAVSLYVKNGKDFVRTEKTLSRGNSISSVDSITIVNEFSPIRSSEYSDQIYYLKRPFGAFRQPFEGMKYAVEGIAKKGQYIEVYYPEKDKHEKRELVENSIYYFVIKKDGPYVNGWDHDNNESITGRFCCEMDIPQADDHIKINPKFRSKLSQAIKTP